MECNLYSERLSFSIKFYTLFNLLLTVRFFYPNAHKSIRFLYYFCLCKSFKELFLFAPPEKRFSFSGCKGTTIFRTTKTFPHFFYVFMRFLCDS